MVKRGLVATRSEAQRLIEEGKVLLRGQPAGRAATLVAPDDPIELSGEPSPFVSRGGAKLDGALRDFDVIVEGRPWLDAGASTGGFTDRLLQGGASRVIAADVGYGQLDWGLRNDPRVVVMERFNIRHATEGDLPFVPEGVVADLSFISLTQVLPALVRVAAPDADHVVLVKPQFEVGKELVGKGGVVRDPGSWEMALRKVAGAALELGLGVTGATVSDLKGPAGNTEFFLHLRRGHDEGMREIERVMEGLR